MTEAGETGRVTGLEAAGGETGRVTEVVIVLGREKGTGRGPKGIEEGTGRVTEAAETGRVTGLEAAGSLAIERRQFALISRAGGASGTTAGQSGARFNFFVFVPPFLLCRLEMLKLCRV